MADVVVYDDDGVPVIVPPPGASSGVRGRISRANRLAALAYERGLADALSEFVPEVLHSLVQVMELTPRVVGLIEDTLDDPLAEGATDRLKAANGLLKTVLSEQRYLFDRVHGRPVQHQRVESESVEVQVQVDASQEAGVVSLREVLRASRDRSPQGQSARVVDAEVVGEEGLG